MRLLKATKVPPPHPAAKTPGRFGRIACRGQPPVPQAGRAPTSFFLRASRRFRKDALPDRGHWATKATNLCVKIPAAWHFPPPAKSGTPDFQPLKMQMFENPGHPTSGSSPKAGVLRSGYRRAVPARDKLIVGRLPPVVGRVFVENLPAFLVQQRVLTYFCGAFNGFTQNSQTRIG